MTQEGRACQDKTIEFLLLAALVPILQFTDVFVGPCEGILFYVFSRTVELTLRTVETAGPSLPVPWQHHLLPLLFCDGVHW